MSKILVVEDDLTLVELLRYNLRNQGYDVVTATDGLEALQVVRREKPDLVILDIMLPKLDGYDTCRFLRQENLVPILMLTAKSEEMDKIMGLELGADDYMTKPFSLKELLARIRALLRRSQPLAAISPLPIKVGELEIDLSRHQVNLGDKSVSLTPKEFDLLALLVTNKGIVFSRDQLLEKVWGYDYVGDTRTVDVHIRWLRQKIEADPDEPRYLITVRGVGYKFEG